MALLAWLARSTGRICSLTRSLPSSWERGFCPRYTNVRRSHVPFQLTVQAEKARDEELETLREAKHALIADKITLGNKVESLEKDLAAKRDDLKTMLAETSEVSRRW